MKQNKSGIYKILLVLFSISLIVIWVLTFQKSDILRADTDALAKVDVITTGVQRIAKLELEGNREDELIEELRGITLEIVPENGEFEYFSTNEEVINELISLSVEYEKFVDVVMDFRANDTRQQLFTTSENSYEASIYIVKVIDAHLVELTEEIEEGNAWIFANVTLIAVLLVKILLDTMKELKRNKELSKDMFIDASTGIYNRAKCQEILKTPIDINDKKERAIIIFDLNDLKKTNDLHGHRAGDDLIATFAGKLKEATNISDDEIFVGRYGGDEFIAYFNSCTELDVKDYLKEVDYVMEQFNEKGDKLFKLSCAGGYAITTPDTKSKPMRELFDEADVNMYNNKVAMKARKKQEMLEQGMEVEEYVDDRV